MGPSASAAPRVIGLRAPLRRIVAELLRRRPELLFVPLAALLLLFSMAPFAFGVGWGVKFLVWLSSPAEPVIYPVTWTASWVTFLMVAIAAWRWLKLHPLRAMLVGAAIPFGATGSFEIVYQIIGARLQPGGFGMDDVAWVGIILWALLGIVSIAFWKTSRLFWSVLVAEIIGFLSWAAIGYPQVTWGGIEQQPAAYAFNIALKVGAFLLFAIPTLQGMARRTSRGIRSAEETPPLRVRAGISPESRKT